MLTVQSEMSLEAKERGPEVSKQGALLITGVALAYWIDLGFVQAKNQIWRIPIAMQCCFAVFSIAGFVFLPDTPRWYYARGRMEEGDAVLARLHKLPVEHEKVQAVRKQVLDAIEEEAKTHFNIWLLFWDTSENQVGRRLRTSFLILFMQQLLGINMLVYYRFVYLSICFNTLLTSQHHYLPANPRQRSAFPCLDSCRGHEHNLCTLLLSSDLDHRAPWTTADDVLDRRRLRYLSDCVHRCPERE